MSTTALKQAPTQDDLTERDVRVQLAACYRLIAHFGMDDLVYTHISARVPGAKSQFLINPYGLMFNEITASSLVKIDYDANIVEDSAYEVNRAGFVIHSAIHMERPDVNCVLHTHTRAGITVSCIKEGVLPLNQMALAFHNRVAYHDYEGVATNLDERQRLVRDLDDKNAMVLRNHGLLTTGRTVPEAFQRMYYLEQSCRIQVDVMATGGTINPISEETAEHTASQFDEFAKERPRGEREWPALLRLLDVKDPSYRH
jgi:ribulose-5-phosphate 4-epimerase/fuculose-1-phosphate aldolase